VSSAAIQTAEEFLQGKGHTYKDNSRNACLKRVIASKEGTHALLIDGDSELIVVNKTDFETRGIDGVHGLVQVIAGTSTYRQPVLLSLKTASRCGYFGDDSDAYLTCVDNSNAYRLLMALSSSAVTADEREQIEAATVQDVWIPYGSIAVRRYSDGNNDKDRVARLKKAVEKDGGNSRATFYLAQALEGAGQKEEAFETYHKRVILGGGSKEEIWYSVYRMGHTAPSAHSATAYFLDAYNFNPTRREPLYALLRNYRIVGKFAACRMFGVTAISIPYPATDPGAYAVELPIYEWATPEELAACMYELGEKTGAIDLLERVINNTRQVTFTQADRERLTSSIAFIKRTL
jgi:tetratricopeptide (TPR) repeat protein